MYRIVSKSQNRKGLHPIFRILKEIWPGACVNIGRGGSTQEFSLKGSKSSYEMYLHSDGLRQTIFNFKYFLFFAKRLFIFSIR